MPRDKKHHKEEGRKRTTSSEDSRKEEDCGQLVKTVCDKKGVVSMTLAANMNVDRSFVGRIVREAGVTTYKGIRSQAEFRPELPGNRGKRGHVGRTWGRICVVPRLCGVRPSFLAVPQLFLLRIFGVPSSRKLTREAGTQNEEVFKEDWEVSEQ